MMRHWLAALLLLFAPWQAMAQTASLVADRIAIEADATLIAEGNVEVLYGATRLTARRVTYDRRNGSLTIEGPMVLSEGADTVILADAAELDPSLREGILTSARMVMNRQLQLAATQIARAGGRYTRLTRVIASSCEICAASDTPQWEIRASRVVHDEDERQLYFSDAQLRVFGVPVFYLPRLRLPDPTLERATGFLVPSIRNRSQLGTGLLFPHFIRLGDHADLTLAPYISGSTDTLEAVYRHELPGGYLRFEGAASRDDIRPGETRAYLFAEGEFALPRDITLAFDLELVSDRSYLFDYGYSEKDRLDSSISLGRVREDQTFRAAVTSFRTLRASEATVVRELPNELLEFDFSQRLMRDPIFGQAWISANVMALGRPADTPTTGRDMAQLGASLDWRHSGQLPLGFVAEAEARLAFDRYLVEQDPNFPDTIDRVTPSAALTLRWPLEKTGTTGARHLLEPVVQLAWAESSGGDVPNEDSTVVEFDEGNLLSLSRFPGDDETEEGLRANIGLSWSRYDASGWSVGATLGRIYRFEDKDQFAEDTGLNGTASDWLIALHYRLAGAIALTSRTLIDDNFDVSRSETRLAWQSDRAALAGTHLWRAADPAEPEFGDLSELSLDGGLRINSFWSATAEWRIDADSASTTRAAVGLRYENECIGVDLSLSRRFTSSTNIEPATELDLRVFLVGLGTGGQSRRTPSRCRG